MRCEKPRRRRLSPCRLAVTSLVIAGASAVTVADAAAQICERTIRADVVALDQVFFWNRLGTVHPQGMIFALRQDVVDRASGLSEAQGGVLTEGNVILREDKRPRPLTLRMNVGDCIEIHFQNLLNPTPVDDEQPATRHASIHAVGMQLVTAITDDGSFVGENPSSLVPPGGTAVYTLYAEREGPHLFYSAAATTGGEGDGGSIPPGLFGALNVEPRNSEWYRSQLTQVEMALATVDTTPAGQPILDYDAVYPPTHPRANGQSGVPILRILDPATNTIVHSDLTAVITGPNRGRLDAGLASCDELYPVNTVLRDRCEPFREFTIVYHDEIGAVQAFAEFEDPVLGFTLHCCRDGFAINYGTGGIGAEILANRFGVGPMWNCNECKYEEFFLSSWVVGDPAMPVDIPANADGDPLKGQPADGFDPDDPDDVGPKATKALYPDDPSNVYHSYISDHVKFRNLHAGPKEHHIHHLHAHQWVNTPDDDESTYLDSQAIGPGSMFTYDHVYDGSGNRPKTPGDAIFHCHFYPHFAQGMWSLWRNHDVFETGTVLDADGRPAPGSRALPDGEIEAGTPIPALVPLPGRPMAPIPTDSFPGYPFYIAGVAGHRPPKPPLDTEVDGGLPRHVIVDDGVQVVNGQPQRVANGTLGSGGETEFPPVNRLDFRKLNITLNALELSEFGTPLEQNAMEFHEQREHPTFVQPTDASAATPGIFLANGLPRQPGAPYADPCGDFGVRPPQVIDRVYKAASFQLDVKHNKAAWHFPQHRMTALQEDVAAFLAETKPPEPMFLRTNTNDCFIYKLTNLIPNEYDLDDFQVRTPTDVIGQHIHLVKFDVTSSDGAANGWNYEDGSLSPEEVIERIEAINAFPGGFRTLTGDTVLLEPEQHPFFQGPLGLGAQTTVQRWFTDDVLDQAGRDRTLRTIFTHDHFGPSTHQQAGLYAGLVAEPQGSEWFHNETGEQLNTRDDGGPTSWQAIIVTADPDSSYREFNFQLHDFALSYDADSDNAFKLFDAGGGLLVEGIADPANAINPPGRVEVGLPFLLARPDECPGGVAPPCPEGVSADDPGTMLVNYRNEPIALRVRDPDTNTQAPEGNFSGDLAAAFETNVFREDPRFNVQPGFYPPLTQDLDPRDPFTPMLRAFEGDRVQIRNLVGAHEEGHNFSVHGVKWLFEPASLNSGYRNSQMMGISEHFEFVIPPLPSVTSGKFRDFLYRAGSSVDDLWNGMWGLMRVHKNNAKFLQKLPNNADGDADITNGNQFAGVCPKTAPVRAFDVTAVLAQNAVPGGAIVYNPRAVNGGPLRDPTAILYVRTADLNAQGQLQAGVPIEPLILRANAGDCIKLTLRNQLPNFGTAMPDTNGFSTLPMIVDDFNANQVRPSRRVGLHVQLLAYDISNSDGATVGKNPEQRVDPGKSRIYTWYAGDLSLLENGTQVATPVEFGVVNLQSTDPIKHSNKGAIGALIIEPQGATWVEDDSTRHAASVFAADGSLLYREFALQFQDDVNLRCDGCGIGPGEPGAGPAADANAVPNLADAEDPEDSGQKAFNYRTEPLWLRMGFDPDAALEETRNENFADALSNAKVGGDPVTPVFEAEVGAPVRFRVVEPGGHQRNHGFQIHGHIWQEEPFVNHSTQIGDNPLSEWKGSQGGIGPTSHFNLLLENGAGGKFGITGDYLYRDFASFLFDGGLWGILRVTPSN